MRILLSKRAEVMEQSKRRRQAGSLSSSANESILIQLDIIPAQADVSLTMAARSSPLPAASSSSQSHGHDDHGDNDYENEESPPPYFAAAGGGKSSKRTSPYAGDAYQPLLTGQYHQAHCERQKVSTLVFLIVLMSGHHSRTPQ